MFRASSTFGPPRMSGPPRMFGGRCAAAPAGVESEWCVSFDGVNDRVSFGSGITVSGEFTFSCWLNTDASASPSWSALAVTTEAYGVHIRSGTKKLYVESTTGSFTFDDTNVCLGRWCHVAITRDSSNVIRAYVDGMVSSYTTANAGSWIITSISHLIFVLKAARVDDYRFYSRALDATEVAALANNTANITTGLTFHLPMEEGTGTTTVDSVGGVTCTLINGPTWHPQTPPKLVSGRETSVRSLSFDGVDDKTSAFGVADNVSAFTLAVWIKRNVGEYGFVASGYTSGYVGLELYPTATYVNCGFTGSAIVSHSADGLWHHYVMVFDGSQTGNANRLKVYIDGVLPALTYSGTILETVSTRFILGWRDWASRYAKMMADDVRVYSRAIDSTDIQKLCCGQSPTTNDPVGWWKGDETSGTLVADSGSGGNNGTCVGGVTRSTDVPPWLAP